MQKDDLFRLFRGKVVIIGIGNQLRGDDGLGPALVRSLQGHVSALCLDVGTSPETYAGKIIKEQPDTVVLVDAVHLGLAPGEYAILGKEDIVKTGFTTHDISLGMFIRYLEGQIETDVFLLGIQPQTIALGADMSDSVVQALHNMTAIIKEILHA